MFPSVDGLSPERLITEIEAAHRLQSMLMARQQAFVAALLKIRTSAEQAEPELQYATVDGYEQTCAEVAAALNISSAAATYQVHYADVLATRLPCIAALLADGQTDWRTVQLIISRTDLVMDGELVASLDEALAERVSRWHTWSRQRVINAIDELVLTTDPDAARERRNRADEDRYIGVTQQPNGNAELYGMVNAAHGEAFDRKLSELAKQVCSQDPRTMMQRRVDALEALTESRPLSCRCGRPECPVRAAAPVAGGIQVVINVVATADTVDGSSDRPGFVEGYGVVDAEQVRELAAEARRRPLEDASTLTGGAEKYVPSAALDRAIRCRDLTCRFPGCSRPARVCDVDHTIPFNHSDPGKGGLTVPENLKCLCRQHHRLKTFGRWRDEQLPDATVVWTSPAGKEYRTHPAGAELFPQLAGRRSRTRAEERAARIARQRNANHVQRPIREAEGALEAARAEEIGARKFRNHLRDMLFVFKGKPSTSPFCTWVNDPREPEELPPDWMPPPPPPAQPDDDPPF